LLRPLLFGFGCFTKVPHDDFAGLPHLAVQWTGASVVWNRLSNTINVQEDFAAEVLPTVQVLDRRLNIIK